MANQEHVEILLRDGVYAWNLWRKEVADAPPDLRGADLRHADLGDANLSGMNLREADLYEAQLRDADLRGADLRGANLRDTDLRGALLGDANLRDADLEYADLEYADLSGTNLSRTKLYSADLTLANLVGAKLSEADLRGAILNRTNLTGADLTAANLFGASCFETNFSAATLSECNVYGIAAWKLNLDGAVQNELRITPLGEETSITVDNLEVAQFLNLLLHHEKMRAVVDTITSKVVLILGRFSDERKPVLDALREALRNHPNGYIPVLFDFDPQTDKPVLETVKTLANLARFIIADLTDPHMIRAELTAIAPNVPMVPIQPIIQADADVPTEYESWALYKSFLPVHRYEDLSDLLASLTESVITSVEGHVQARRL